MRDLQVHPDGSVTCGCGWSAPKFDQTHDCVSYLQGQVRQLELQIDELEDDLMKELRKAHA